MNLDLLLWSFLASYVLHILDETLMNGGFVRWISSSFWPLYNGRMFFWFNTGLIVAITVSNLLYDLFGGHWIVLALAFPFGFAFHGVASHLFWTVYQRSYSPGLATSLFYWILAYLIVRYGLLAGNLSLLDFWAGLVGGVLTVGLFITVGPTILFPALTRSRASHVEPASASP